MLYGYARVSSVDQSLAVQEDALKAAGCQTIRSEKVTGTTRDGRTELATLMDFIREGDTLVVDVTNFNDKTWFDRAGNFHSEALHLVERFTPITPDVIRYDVTIEDPKVFTRPWRISMPLYRRMEPNMQLLEYRCTEFVEEFMYGHVRKEQLVKRWEGETMIVEITRKVPPGDRFYEWFRR